MKYLVTGGCGFLGSNLSAEVINQGEELIVFDNLSRKGGGQNLEWLDKQGVFNFIHGDIRENEDVERAIRIEKPDVVFHLAGQVAMTTSIDNPRLDFEVNALGTFNLLDSIRKYSPETIVFYSSTNKVYGDMEWVLYQETKTRYVVPDYPRGFPENIPLAFHSPYGCSKGTADQYMLDYYRIHGIRTIVFRHSSMYGGRQFATFDQGWIGWFCKKALEIKKGISKEPFSISGTGKQVRDVLHSTDVISLYFKAVKKIDSAQGQVFNIGGGMENSLSLIELFEFLEEELDVSLSYEKHPWRQTDQKVFVADNEKINSILGWQPNVNRKAGIKMMLDWLDDNYYLQAKSRQWHDLKE